MMYKILIAEDESEMRNLLIKYIKRTQPDLEVVGSATNGKEALMLTEQYRPDIVITDISMPILNGLEFLQEVLNRNIPVKAVVISGYDEFSYAKKAISLGVSDYLLKPFEPKEFKSVLEKIKMELLHHKTFLDNVKLLKEKVDFNEKFLKEQVLRNLLNGKCEQELLTGIFDCSANYYGVCLMKIPRCLTIANCQLKHEENLEELAIILSAGCISKNINVQGIGFEENGAVLILSGNASNQQEFLFKIKQGLYHLQKSMEKYYDAFLVFIVGEICDKWENLKNSYEQTLKIWRGLTTTDDKLIIYGERKKDQSQVEMFDSSKMIQNLKQQIVLSVRMAKEQDTQKNLEELMKVYASIAPKKTDFVEISAEELVYAIFSEVERNNISLDKEKSNDDIQEQMKKQLKYASLLEIKNLLLEYFEMCYKAFREHDNFQQSEMIVENVKKIITCNLDKDELTLEWIASQVHFSVTYVRQIFKQKTGESIMEYVIRKRMEKSGQLLLKTEMKIQQIAEICGYKNQRYFASSFKKYYDCTPTEFKNQFRNHRF